MLVLTQPELKWAGELWWYHFGTEGLIGPFYISLFLHLAWVSSFRAKDHMVRRGYTI